MPGPSFTALLDRELYLLLDAAMSIQDGHEFVDCAVCGYTNDATIRMGCKRCGVHIPEEPRSDVERTVQRDNSVDFE